MTDQCVIGVIPARYSSTRFPGKPLADINGKSMVVRVAEQAEKCRLLSEVIIATDDQRIYDHAREHGIKAVMTVSDIRTGTDRCWAAVKGRNSDIVVNIQGDEPLLNPDVIDSLISALASSNEFVCSTPVKMISDLTEADNKNVVKTVFDKNMSALYFSRSKIPFDRNPNNVFYKHLGIYAYKTDFLKTFVELESTKLELSESLEQLRILENGFRIKCVEVQDDSVGVDTPEDLERVRKIISEIEK
jgi:3-deoxy-manno-octulosonate cytidylyltransferase (CMP-KDO synthetase)